MRLAAPACRLAMQGVATAALAACGAVALAQPAQAAAQATAPAAHNCAPTVVRAVMRAGDVTGEPVAATCRASVESRDELLVALVPAAPEQALKQLLVAVVQRRGTQVLALGRREVEEDAALRFGPNSLHIDTARYVLAPGRRAFGVDITGAYQPSCADVEPGAMRTLFLRDGSALRPVLVDLLMQSRSFENGPGGRCAAPDAPPSDPVVNLERTTIAVRAGQKRGLSDLVVTTTVVREGTRSASNKMLSTRSVTWRYDGTQYRAAGTP